ncbi:MAG: aquaporin [Bacteroidota bacterium]
MSKYLAEFIGTFFLVFVIGLTAGSNPSIMALSVGATITALMYMGRTYSQAHYNPAVTLGVLIIGKINLKDSGLYLAAQLLGALAAAPLATWLVQDDSFVYVIEPAGSARMVEILLAEIFFTFLLVLVILTTGFRNHSIKNTDQAPLAIGLAIVGAIYAVNPISGSVLNPAVGTGPNIFALNFLPIWYYWVGPMLGGALAAFIFRVMEGNM